MTNFFIIKYRKQREFVINTNILFTSSKKQITNKVKILRKYLIVSIVEGPVVVVGVGSHELVKGGERHRSGWQDGMA